MANAVTQGLSEVFDNIADWAKSPFSTDMDLGKWFLFTGMVITIIAAWMLILRDIHHGVE